MHYIKSLVLAILAILLAATFSSPVAASPRTNPNDWLCVLLCLGSSKPVALPAPSSNGRIDQSDHAQYVSQSEWATWHKVSCSAASMTYVLNTKFKRHFIIHDILQAEQGQISSSLGLISGARGITITVNNLGYRTSQINGGIDGIANASNGGNPVIVSMQNRDWPFGHILVVTGADSNNLTVVDSWGTNKTSISRTDFSAQWTGLSVSILKNEVAQ